MLKFYGFITERLFIMVLKMQYGRQRGTYMCTYLSRHKYENIEPKRFAILKMPENCWKNGSVWMSKGASCKTFFSK